MTTRSGVVSINALFLRCCLLLFSCMTLLACSDGPKLSSLPPGTVVLAFGDSITAGVGAARGQQAAGR